MPKKTALEYSELYEKAILLRKQGKLGTEIALELGVSARAVQDWFKNGKRIPKVVQKLDEAKEMLINGQSYKDVAEAIGVSSKRLRETLPGMGWTQSQAAKHRNLLNYPTYTRLEGVNKNMPVNKDSPAAFDKALNIAVIDPDAPQPQCIRPVGEVSPWIDWATEVEEREEYESRAPTEREAKLLCGDCPLESICTEAALARPPYHGVRGSGLRFEGGKRLRI